MKILIITMLLIISLNAESIYKQEDKQKHFTGSMAISLVTSAYLINNGYSKTEAFIYGVCASLIVGIGKEVYDEISYGGADANDLVAGIAGATAGALVAVQFNWEF